MAPEEREERETPSVPKRKGIEIGKGVVLLPPEKIGRKKEPRPALPQKKIRFEEVKAPQQNLISILSIFFALIAIALAVMVTLGMNEMRAELLGIAEDLRAFKEADIYIDTQLVDITHKVDASIPMKEVITPFTIPIKPQEMEGSGTISIILPGQAIPTAIPWSGSIMVTGDVEFDTSELSPERTFSISYELPAKRTFRISIKGSDLWTPQLEDITQRIEDMAR